MSEEQAKPRELTAEEKLLAIEQFKKFGRVISCKDCREFVADGNGYGFCGSGRIVRVNDYCSRGKVKE